MMIADRIKALRTESHISQSELAKRLGVTRSSVNAWELGISTPTTQYIVEMARLFHVSTDFILGVKQQRQISMQGLTQQEIEILLQLVECFHNSHSQQAEE